MFSLQEIRSLNELELAVYNYVISNADKVYHMSIRDLSEQTHVSTTTILRFCKKMNCDGFTEFKFKLKTLNDNNGVAMPTEDAAQMIDFFKKINNQEFDQLLDRAAEMIVNKDRVLFIGVGSSGSLGKYGARFFSNIGKFAQYLDDPFYPVPDGYYDSSVTIVLSVSGETEETLRQVSRFKRKSSKIVSITNYETCTLAKLSDLNIAYYMPLIMVQNELNITSQVPVVFILEMIGRKIQKLLQQ
ncbi:MurR/RpiR family transcriptional regulator [Robertmurraya sp. DFI.2.37]|uniref:MurR/RpiR family transcriptional regulator n=1 Tax=Robertmurraya sp. DFI.2.37 TaxID=3031819 RepID=UPI001248ACE1|nr:MurR/RpiR family transcriptional regulator [Robertmurraya sp. DFI.2.37]MDF1509404.1 MurR/RpiR family transcriptional regulator [Robertmurraya sp. DFI.2.37]